MWTCTVYREEIEIDNVLELIKPSDGIRSDDTGVGLIGQVGLIVQLWPLPASLPCHIDRTI